MAGAVLVLLACAPSARAAEVDAHTLRRLARRAVTSPVARARLAAVTSVDGRRFEVRALLRGASGDELRARLRTLAKQVGPPPVDVRTVKARADEILSAARYRPVALPRPLRGVVETLARWLDPVARGAARLLEALLGGSGGIPAAWAVVALCGAAVIARVALRGIGGRAPWLGPARGADRTEAPDDPATLERLAEEARRAGDLEGALRLRWRAGAVRLAAAGVLSGAHPPTSHEIARRAGSSDLEQLARTFDEVAYGGRRATLDDVERAAAAWSVLPERGR